MNRSSSINHNNHNRSVANYNNNGIDRPSQPRLPKICLNQQNHLTGQHNLALRQDQQNQTCFNNVSSSYKSDDNRHQGINKLQQHAPHSTQSNRAPSPKHCHSNSHRANQLNQLHQHQQKSQSSMNQQQIIAHQLDNNSMDQHHIMEQHQYDGHNNNQYHDQHNQYHQMHNNNLMVNQQQQQQHINGDTLMQANGNYLQSQQAANQTRQPRSQQSMAPPYSAPMSGHQSQQIDSNVVNNNSSPMLLNQHQQQPNKLYGSQQSQQHPQSVVAQQQQQHHHHHHHHNQQQRYNQNPINELPVLAHNVTIDDQSIQQQSIMHHHQTMQPTHQQINGHTHPNFTDNHNYTPDKGNNYNNNHQVQLQQNHIGPNQTTIGPTRQTHQPVRNVPYSTVNPNKRQQPSSISRHRVPLNQQSGHIGIEQQQGVVVNACSPFDQDQYASPSPTVIQNSANILAASTNQPMKRTGSRSNLSININYQQQQQTINNNNGNNDHPLSNQSQQQYDVAQTDQQQQSYISTSEHLNVNNNDTGLPCYNNNNNNNNNININGAQHYHHNQQQHMTHIVQTQSHYQPYQNTGSPTVGVPPTQTNQQSIVMQHNQQIISNHHVTIPTEVIAQQQLPHHQNQNQYQQQQQQQQQHPHISQQRSQVPRNGQATNHHLHQSHRMNMMQQTSSSNRQPLATPIASTQLQKQGHHYGHHQPQIMQQAPPPSNNYPLNGQRAQAGNMNDNYYSQVNNSNSSNINNNNNSVTQAYNPITINQQPPMIASATTTNQVIQQPIIPSMTNHSSNVHNQPATSTDGLITNYGTSSVMNNTPPIHQQQQHQYHNQSQQQSQPTTGTYNINQHNHHVNSVQTNNHQGFRTNNMLKNTNQNIASNHYVSNNSNSHHLHNHPNPIGNPTPPLTPTSGPQQRVDHVNGLPGSVIQSAAYLSSPPHNNAPRHSDIIQKSSSTDNLEPRLTIVKDILLAPFKLDHEAQYSSFEFHIKPQTFQLLKNHGQDHELQFKAFPVNDPKCHTSWPNGFELSVNHQIIGSNRYQARKALDIKTSCCIGHNLIELTITACCCSHLFSLELVERPTIRSMVNRIINQHQLPRDYFVQRIKRDFNSFACNNNKNIDQSDGIEQTAIKMTLKCPITKQRIQVPVRGQDCKHLTCFDLEAYLMLHGEKQANDWRCPICKTLAPYHKLELDNYIRWIIENNSNSMDIDDIIIDSNATWKPSFSNKSNQLNISNSLLADHQQQHHTVANSSRTIISQQRQSHSQSSKQTSNNESNNSNNTLIQSIGSPALTSHNNICLPILSNRPLTNNTSTGYNYDHTIINKTCEEQLDPLTAMERSLMQHEQQMGPPFVVSDLIAQAPINNTLSSCTRVDNTNNESISSQIENQQADGDDQQTTNIDNNNIIMSSATTNPAATITISCSSTPATPSSTILANGGPETPATPSNSGSQHCAPPAPSSSTSLSTLIDNQQHNSDNNNVDNQSKLTNDTLDTITKNNSNDLNSNRSFNGHSEPDPLDVDNGVDQLELLDYLDSTGNSSSTPDAILELFNN